MYVGRGMWSPGNVGQQIHVGPIYGDTYAVRHQMLVGQESNSVIEAMRRGRGRFLSGLGADSRLSMQNLSDFKVVGSWHIGAFGPVPIPLEGALLQRISRLGPPVANEVLATDWAQAQCAVWGKRIFADVQIDQGDSVGNHMIATSDPQVLAFLEQTPALFFGAGVPVPVLEIACPAGQPAPGPQPGGSGPTPQPKPSWWPDAYPYPGYVPPAEWPGDPNAGGGGGGPAIDPSQAPPGGAQAAPTPAWKRAVLAGAVGVGVATLVYFTVLKGWKPGRRTASHAA